MTTPYTPGPWAVQDIGSNCLRITGNMPLEIVPHESRDYYSAIASVTQRDAHPRYDAGISRQTCAANARLMAAAPDLLEALKLAEYLLSGANINGNVVERKVREAIKKAEGDV
jgi:hypothetical protein